MEANLSLDEVWNKRETTLNAELKLKIRNSQLNIHQKWLWHLTYILINKKSNLQREETRFLSKKEREETR